MASQCHRILEVLRDGRPHRMEEIHQRAGFMRLNSRISELRDRGHDIVCDKTGGEYVYTLVSLRDPASARLGTDGAGSRSESGVGKLAVSGAGGPSSSDAASNCDQPVTVPAMASRLVPERRSHFEPLGGGEERPTGEKPGGAPGRASHGDAAKDSPPPSGVQLTVWSEAGMAA